MSNVETDEAIRAARVLEDFVNPYGHKKEPFIEQITRKCHRTLQQVIFGLVIGLIKAWAEMYKAGWYDGRNEDTCKTCNDIVETMNKNHKDWQYLPFI